MSVLVAVDPGRRSASVVQYGALLARSLGQPLVVGAVTPRKWPASARGADTEWLEYADASANLVLDHAAAVLGGDVEAAFVTHEASSTKQGLLELAEDRSARIIVLGSNPSAEIGQIGLGTGVDELLHSSAVPLGIAPRGYRAGSGALISRVTAALDGSSASRDAAHAAASLAVAAGASLRLASFAVNVPAPLTAGVGGNAETLIQDEWAGRMQAEADGLSRTIADLPNPPTVQDGVIGTGESWAAAEAAVQWGTRDVLVVGSPGRRPLARALVGSHAGNVIRHSPVPVIVLPPGYTELQPAGSAS